MIRPGGITDPGTTVALKTGSWRNFRPVRDKNKCKRRGEPVAIGRLERYVADWEIEKGLKIPEKAAPTGKKVAVVGSGPSGLTIAAELAKKGHEVTILETLHLSGGVLVYGIPEFRLPKRIVETEVEYVKKLGVKILTDVVVGKTMTVDDLLKEYDAVFLGTGAGLPRMLGLPGEDLIGIYTALLPLFAMQTNFVFRSVTTKQMLKSVADIPGLLLDLTVQHINP